MKYYFLLISLFFTACSTSTVKQDCTQEVDPKFKQSMIDLCKDHPETCSFTQVEPGCKSPDLSPKDLKTIRNTCDQNPELCAPPEPFYHNELSPKK